MEFKTLASLFQTKYKAIETAACSFVTAYLKIERDINAFHVLYLNLLMLIYNLALNGLTLIDTIKLTI
jgi:hypothetical protein